CRLHPTASRGRRRGGHRPLRRVTCQRIQEPKAGRRGHELRDVGHAFQGARGTRCLGADRAHSLLRYWGAGCRGRGPRRGQDWWGLLAWSADPRERRVATRRRPPCIMTLPLESAITSTTAFLDGTVWATEIQVTLHATFPSVQFTAGGT